MDDNRDNRQLLIRLLNPFGFELREASNGQEAIEVWEMFEPHLIWMDMRMPVMNGYEATKQIKSTTKGQATAVIALTASTLGEERFVALEAGCDDFIRKPFRESDIFDAINKHIGVRYVYDELTNQPDLTHTKTFDLTQASLDALPADWLANFHQATIDCDLDLMLTLIAQIHDRHEPLALALADLVHKFQFEKLLSLSQSKTN